MSLVQVPTSQSIFSLICLLVVGTAVSNFNLEAFSKYNLHIIPRVLSYLSQTLPAFKALLKPLSLISPNFKYHSFDMSLLLVMIASPIAIYPFDAYKPFNLLPFITTPLTIISVPFLP